MIVVGGGPAGAATAIVSARRGHRVLLIERGVPPRHKPCGGVLPQVAEETIEDIIGVPIPEEVFSDPSHLGLYYVPPSGRENGGRVRGYSILNVDRDAFDDWILTRAIVNGVQVKFGATFVGFVDKSHTEVVYSSPEGIHRARARFVVGADGVRSRVRDALGGGPVPLLVVAQYYLPRQAAGAIANCFYGLFREDISPSYAYAIPKDKSLIVGTGVLPKQEPNVAVAMRALLLWIREEFGVATETILRREAWAIPYGFFNPGERNVILVGDAAGLCNPLSGEGIRLAIESGEAAADAIDQATRDSDAADIYRSGVRRIADFVQSVRETIDGWSNGDREQFVREELTRRM